MAQAATQSREDLRAWYRQAMTRRAAELRDLREGLAGGDGAALADARAVGQALRGSGATFGFPNLSAVAALVERATGSQIARRVEGLIEHLDRLSAGPDDGAQVRAEWLLLASGAAAPQMPFPDIVSAWRRVAEASGLSESELVGRVASGLGVGAAELGRAARSALRLVPEALMRRDLVLPIREDAETLVVASADPTSLGTELELTRLTGREVVFTVASPEAIQLAMDAVLTTRSRQPPPRRRVAVGAGEPEKILVVDDDGASRLLARTVLEKRGYAVDEAGDGLEALDLLRDGPMVSLVVADLNMPMMDGLELLWEMRGDEDLAHIPVIVLTGETDEALETKLIEEGADDYVCKPLDPRLFLARVSATIRRADA